MSSSNYTTHSIWAACSMFPMKVEYGLFPMMRACYEGIAHPRQSLRLMREQVGSTCEEGPHNHHIMMPQKGDPYFSRFAFLFLPSEVHSGPGESSDPPCGDFPSQCLPCACCHWVHPDLWDSQDSL